MRLKVGDKIKVKPIEWYAANKHSSGILSITKVDGGREHFTSRMSQYCGKEVEIKYCGECGDFYCITNPTDGSVIMFWVDEFFDFKDYEVR
jgi:hypothetical protein